MTGVYRKLNYIAIVMALYMLQCASASAGMFAWDSYKVRISDKYSLVKIDSIDIFLTRDERIGEKQVAMPVVMPADFPVLGRLHELAVSEKYLFARHFGKRKRNLYEGDKLLVTDSSKLHWIIINKKNNDILGPISRPQFEQWVKALRIKTPEKWVTVEQLYHQSLLKYPTQHEHNRIIGKTLFMAPINGLLVFMLLFLSLAVLLLPYHHYGIIGSKSCLRWSLTVPGLCAIIIVFHTLSSSPLLKM